MGRDLGGTKDGNLELNEDNIGLHARATITDKEVIEKAREGSLVGWSFGFKDREVENSVEQGIPTRDVKDLDLYEVSILDRTKSPAYEGTLISVRSEEEFFYLEGLMGTGVTLTYDANGGTGSIAPVVAAKDSSVTLSNGTGLTAPTGKVFGGWMTSATGAETIAGPTYTVAANTILYAKWNDQA